jgi:hypothetical protein
MISGLQSFERESTLDEESLYDDQDFDSNPTPIEAVTGDHAMDAFLSELSQAQNKFSGGYVGLGYFLTRWRSAHLDSTPETRRRVLDKLLAEGFVETYNAPDGALAIRVSDRVFDDAGAS